VRSRSQLDFQNHIGFEAMREPSLMPSFPTQFGPHSARMRTRPTELPQISWLLSPSIPFQAGSQCPIAPPQGAGRTYCTEAASREAVVVDLDVRKDIRLASSSAVKQTAQLRTSEYFVSCKMDFASDHALHQTNAWLRAGPLARHAFVSITLLVTTASDGSDAALGNSISSNK
jgi:hypothetical protein